VQQKITLVRGEWRVSNAPDCSLTTLLGSCVAACIRDPQACVGGMNHFLLPGTNARSPAPEAERYGVHLMELLINGLLTRGAQKNRLEAKLFGGGHVVPGLSDIGQQNVAFAEKFLRDEGIRLIGGSVRGAAGRKIEFWPVSGRARQMFLSKDELPAESRAGSAPVAAQSGAVELF
jgi:chemotaxis protein CheD